MAQMASHTIPPRGLWTLKLGDFLKGAVLSCSAQLLALLDFWFHADHFPTWIEWQPYVKAAVYFFVLYLAKNFFSNNVGQFAKADKPVVAVDEQHLEKIVAKADAHDAMIEEKKQL